MGGGGGTDYLELLRVHAQQPLQLDVLAEHVEEQPADRRDAVLPQPHLVRRQRTPAPPSSEVPAAVQRLAVLARPSAPQH